MIAGRAASDVILAACCFATSAVCFGADPSAPNRDFSSATLAKIIPGVTTETDVQALLGKSDDMQFGSGTLCPPKPSNKSVEPTVDSWNYRGRDANGRFIVHIEFDANYVTYLVAKIPTNGVGVARRAQPQPSADQQPSRTANNP